MTTDRRFWSQTLIAAVLLGGAIAAGSARPAAQAPAAPALGRSPATGAHLFRTYCASCHGERALGDGPLSASLRRSPPNLTELAKRNNGVYPKEMVFKIIDGRQRVAGHGGPEMPVWGDAFQRSIEVADEKALTMRIQALVDFLETIQLRDAE
jgi:mono/diheme cytochrome c family protein